MSRNKVGLDVQQGFQLHTGDYMYRRLLADTTTIAYYTRVYTYTCYVRI